MMNGSLPARSARCKRRSGKGRNGSAPSALRGRHKHCRISGRQEIFMKTQMFTAMATGLALIAATPAIAQQGGTTVTTATTQGPILSFSVSEEVRARPDQATVGAGVQTTAPTAVEAMRANAAAMEDRKSTRLNSSP